MSSRSRKSESHGKVNKKQKAKKKKGIKFKWSKRPTPNQKQAYDLES